MGLMGKKANSDFRVSAFQTFVSVDKEKGRCAPFPYKIKIFLKNQKCLAGGALVLY